MRVSSLARPPVVVTDPVILIRINQLYEPGMSGDALYEATRGVWRVGPRREQARYALAVFQGDVVGAFRIDGWQPAGTSRYTTRQEEDVLVPGRWEFRGGPAEDSVASKYVGRSVKAYLPRGLQNPIVYVNC